MATERPPLVSVVLAVRNAAAVIGPCLASLVAQTYHNMEIIVVDNASTDDTRTIVQRDFPGARLVEAGPERCAQRNAGARLARGRYLFFPDADMVLAPDVIAKCVRSGGDLVIVPEVTRGRGFWAKVRRYERDFYAGQEGLEAGRFLSAVLFHRIGGYDENLFAAGEDWDLHHRAAAHTRAARIDSVVVHDEGPVTLASYLAKKKYYARFLRRYALKWGGETREQLGWRRVLVYLRQPRRILARPLLFLAMAVMLGAALLVFRTTSSKGQPA